jgi:hypothetical protein
MVDRSQDAPSGEGRRHIAYVITCGTCGQSWQRAAALDGQVVHCIFCGCQGHLRLGATPADGDSRGHWRVEVWLHTAGDVAG